MSHALSLSRSLQNFDVEEQLVSERLRSRSMPNKDKIVGDAQGEHERKTSDRTQRRTRALRQ